jgi:hypothetical protein
MNDAAAREPLEAAETPPATTPAPADAKSIGSIDIHIREVDVSRPTRSVNRMWPNR